MKLATAFEVFDEIVSSGLEASIHARRSGLGEMDFIVTVALVDRTQEQLSVLSGIVDRYKVELDVDQHRYASLS